MRIEACLSSKSDLWRTPKNIYDYYKERNYFDPCPTNPTFNGLEVEWKDNNFVNPPYSQIAKWIDKSIEENRKGKNVVLLIPARTGTKWFKKLVENGAYLYFIHGRLRFNDEKNYAPFDSMIVILNYFSLLRIKTINLIDRNLKEI